MFDQVMKRSNWVWIYKMGRFAEERRAFLCDLNEQGHSMQTLRNVNRILLAVAERVDVRRSTDISEMQIVQAARNWVAKSCASHSRAETREAATKRFVYVAKNWLRFLGKWRDPERNPQLRAELDSFLRELRDERGYSDQTLSTRASALNLFFEWLGKQDISLKDVSTQTLAAYFLENKARGWKKATIKVYAQSLRVFLRYAEQHNWCAPGLAETIESPRMYSMAGLPEGPSWEQVRRLIASLNSERPGHIRDRAIILLLALYGLRIGEVCALTLDDLDWTNEKIRVRRPKNRTTQEFPLTAEVGDAILKYLQMVRPHCSSRHVFLLLRGPHRPMKPRHASCSISLRVRTLGCHLSHYGPHVLRHACATHLLDEGFSLKEIGDHLGHRSTRSTGIYAKVERRKLEQVADGRLSNLTEYLRTQAQPITAAWSKDRLNSLRQVSNIRLGGLQ